MCDFSTAYYHDGTPVPYVGHIDDFYDGDCCCWQKLYPEITRPGMYGAGHTGCWSLYFDGNKTYVSTEELPYGMYWKDRCCWDVIERKNEVKFYIDEDWDTFMIGDCIATCLNCFAAGYECKCGNRHLSMDSDVIRRAKKKKGLE